MEIVTNESGYDQGENIRKDDELVDIIARVDVTGESTIVRFKKHSTMTLDEARFGIWDVAEEKNADEMLVLLSRFDLMWRHIKRICRNYDEVRLRYNYTTDEYVIRTLNEMLPSNTIILVIKNDSEIRIHSNRSLPERYTTSMKKEEAYREHYPHCFTITKHDVVKLYIESCGWDELFRLALGDRK